MGIVVQKYGGSSVATAEHIKAVAQRVKKAREKDGRDLVVVVSAMGKTTDRLLGLADEVARDPSPREIDQLLSTGEQQSVALLAMALHDRGVAATSLSGSQAGMKTTGSCPKRANSAGRALHTSARPPVLAKGTASLAASRIFTSALHGSVYL